MKINYKIKNTFNKESMGENPTLDRNRDLKLRKSECLLELMLPRKSGRFFYEKHYFARQQSCQFGLREIKLYVQFFGIR